MTDQKLSQQIALAVATSKELLAALRSGRAPADELLERRGRHLHEVAVAAARAPMGVYSAEMRELADLDVQLSLAAGIYRAGLAAESLTLQRERTVLQFAGGETFGGAVDFSA